MDEPTCSHEDGCDKPVRARGLCSTHYARISRESKRTGIPLPAGRRSAGGLTAEDRFWAMVSKDGPVPAHRPELGPCWVWTGGKMNSGYGNFCRGAAEGGGYVGAHRFAYELLAEPIPDDLDL